MGLRATLASQTLFGASARLGWLAIPYRGLWAPRSERQAPRAPRPNAAPRRSGVPRLVRSPHGRHQRGALLPVRQVLGRVPHGRRDDTAAARHHAPTPSPTTARRSSATTPCGCASPARPAARAAPTTSTRRASSTRCASSPPLEGAGHAPRNIRRLPQVVPRADPHDRPPVRGRPHHAVQAAQRRPAPGRRRRRPPC